MTKDKITDEYIKAVQKQFKHYHAKKYQHLRMNRVPCPMPA